METLPQCDFFCLWTVTERTQRERERERKKFKKRGKGKATQPQSGWRYVHTWRRSCQKPQNELENIVREGAACATETSGKIVSKSFFLKKKLHNGGDVSRSCCYLYIRSLLFQSMINGRKSLAKGGVDLVLLSLSTSPHPAPPFRALRRPRDSSLPPLPSPPPDPSLLWTEPQSSRAGRASNLLVDIVPLFKFQ